MSAKDKSKAKSSNKETLEHTEPTGRYARPPLMPETLEDLKMLGIMVGEAPLPKGAEDAWLWEEARTITGKPMHRLLLKAVRAAYQEDEMLRLCPPPSDGSEGLLRPHIKARTEIFKTICNRALKRRDSEFFRHLADCMSPQRRRNKKTAAEPTKAEVLHSYQMARGKAFLRVPVKTGDEAKIAWAQTLPSWADIREEMQRRGCLPLECSEKEQDNQRRQIERAAKALGLPLAQKRE